MDEFFLQLSELNRAGWSFQISPESDAPTMPAVRAAILWSLQSAMIGVNTDEVPIYPLIDWINLYAPESELRTAVARMHASVFKIPPEGDFPTPAR